MCGEYDIHLTKDRPILITVNSRRTGLSTMIDFRLLKDFVWLNLLCHGTKYIAEY